MMTEAEAMELLVEDMRDDPTELDRLIVCEFGSALALLEHRVECGYMELAA